MNSIAFKLVFSILYTLGTNKPGNRSFPVYFKKSERILEMIQSLENLTGPTTYNMKPGQMRSGSWVSRGLFSHSSGTDTEQKFELEFSLRAMWLGQTRTLLMDRYFLVYKVGCQSSLVTAAEQTWRHPKKIECADYKGLFVIIERGEVGKYVDTAVNSGEVCNPWLSDINYRKL